jgi:hypothetical protein
MACQTLYASGGLSVVDSSARPGPAALKAGARDNGAPGPRSDYSPTCYAAFVIDPDGNNVEAVLAWQCRPAFDRQEVPGLQDPR